MAQAVSCARWVRQCTRADEETWLAPARCGERWALERFYNSYRGTVYSVCFRLTGRAEDAEDAMQAAFIRAFRELPRFRGESAVKTWIYRIAVNESLTVCRRRRDEPELNECVLPTADTAPTVAENLAVRAAMARLAPDHRAILTLRFWEGLSGPEIAEVLGITLPAVKMRLHRARHEFRRCYEERP